MVLILDCSTKCYSHSHNLEILLIKPCFSTHVCNGILKQMQYKFAVHFGTLRMLSVALSAPYISTNICCKSRMFPSTDTRNYSIDLR